MVIEHLFTLKKAYRIEKFQSYEGHSGDGAISKVRELKEFNGIRKESNLIFLTGSK